MTASPISWLRFNRWDSVNVIQSYFIPKLIKLSPVDDFIGWCFMVAQSEMNKSFFFRRSELIVFQRNSTIGWCQSELNGPKQIFAKRNCRKDQTMKRCLNPLRSKLECDNPVEKHSGCMYISAPFISLRNTHTYTRPESRWNGMKRMKMEWNEMNTMLGSRSVLHPLDACVKMMSQLLPFSPEADGYRTDGRTNRRIDGWIWR